jgi:hypothetical protein
MFLPMSNSELLHRQSDLVPHLQNNKDPSNYPSGAVQRSKGWQEKVTDNPNINSDPRNQAITMSADGVPLFKDRNAGSAWIFVTRASVLPDALQTGLAYVHMNAFEMSEHKTWDDVSKTVIKVKRYVSCCITVVIRHRIKNNHVNITGSLSPSTRSSLA